jgi:hypothetical protein
MLWGILMVTFLHFFTIIIGNDKTVVEQWLQEYHPELASRSNFEDPFRQLIESQQEVSNLLDTFGSESSYSLAFCDVAESLLSWT